MPTNDTAGDQIVDKKLCQAGFNVLFEAPNATVSG
jgi:hypothetical protein